MTGLEAALCLRSYVTCGSFETMTDRQREAIEMAIEALMKLDGKGEKNERTSNCD